MKINQINSNNASDIKSKLSTVWKNIPLFIRVITFITIIFYIINLFIPYISFYLSNIPYYTILKIQIWRIVSTSLITTEIINIIFSLIFWVKYASELESSMGTIKYFLIFMMNSIIIQIFYSLISCLIAFIINKKTYLLTKINSKNSVSNSGIWPNIICELTLLSLSNPNQLMKFLFFPCQFKAKYYPLILFIIFSIMNSFTIDLEVLIGMLYAFFYFYFIKKFIKISDNLVIKIENLKCMKCFTRMGGFVSVNTLGNKFVSTVNSINQKIKEISIQNNKGFSPFGGEGVKVGGSFKTMGSDDYIGVNENTFTGTQKSQNESLDVKIQ